jgi:hypothetical protein
MNLNDAQKAQLQKWIEEGCNLSEIQSKLSSEFGINLTYMETRFLMDDLQVQPQDAEPVPEQPPLNASAPSEADETDSPLEAPSAEPDASPGQDPFAAPGDVAVKVDTVTRAGAIVSGKVTFSDGKNADWYLDQYGRLGLAPQEQGYKPSQADLMLFQGELQSELAKMGY